MRVVWRGPLVGVGVPLVGKAVDRVVGTAWRGDRFSVGWRRTAVVGDFPETVAAAVVDESLGFAEASRAGGVREGGEETGAVGRSLLKWIILVR